MYRQSTSPRKDFQTNRFRKVDRKSRRRKQKHKNFYDFIHHHASTCNHLRFDEFFGWLERDDAI